MDILDILLDILLKPPQPFIGLFFFLLCSYDHNVWIGIEAANTASFVFSSDSSSATYFDWQNGVPTVGPGDESKSSICSCFHELMIFTKQKNDYCDTLEPFFMS